MGPETKTTGKKKAAKAVPSFTLRADREGDIFALIAAVNAMGPGEARDEAVVLIREFELYAE